MKDKKQFTLEQIAPYYANPKNCGFDGIACRYFTIDGKSCIVGNNLIDPKKFEKYTGDAIRLFSENKQSEILKPESVNILSGNEWYWLQRIHDSIALRQNVKYFVEKSLLFTFEELQQAAEKYKQEENK